MKELPDCPVEIALLVVGDRWRILIIRELLGGTKRFSELQRGLGKVTQKVLTAHLRSMEEMGIVARKVYAEVPPRVEYSLTESGRSLRRILSAMAAWGTEFKEKYGACEEA